MRKTLLCLLLILIGLCACKKETDPLFGMSPDARINDTLQHYQQVLTGAAYGWKALVYPAGTPGTVFSFFFRFSNNNRVEMLADITAAASYKTMESSWRLKALQQPCLLFDTYSYLHVLCDPDGNVSGGQNGKGLGSDFEFAINGMKGDTLLLTGRFNGSRAMLIKATQQEETAYYKQGVNRALDSVVNILTYFHRLNTGRRQYDLHVNRQLHQLTFTWMKEGNMKKVTTGYYYTLSGIALSPAFEDSAATVINSFDGVKWEHDAVTFKISGEQAAITATPRPVAVDPTAPARWYRAAADIGRYWVSYKGFHVNGVDDAFNISSLPDFLGLCYWPEIEGPGTGIDWLSFIIKTTDGPVALYGPGYTPPEFTPDGRIIFNDAGMFGRLPPNRRPVDKTRAKMADSEGFYLVQTGEKSYDMVSAADARVWITWKL
ncbi:DUF4302 domain-containing protein [Chitinophaga nivalis]|uniref:DUF4302 domain-containing protein n=1 Tax=Chitinophaga nivalis TaxID=2991709 RepID=A0ABT3IFL8_9BACT|nr:DUF4302 domain-containing protein [Chitinophaga nivalis]MCW3467602.1 DUF4302 domain-containing protein [Chitinophaga nivalis]MCW3482706.1 DUF4302 domain-containing protein [Chitinophaga nivalis]